ncbi:zf-HC2 domain-containing protein [Aneurinibacillus sp. Ricciae_BoGa-3]|uniref:anti-sigma factor family protein n=1 Tax=Aneurinibacillus sp. Ricciae_BoGa-3 TaxID=3022697 RepID=UPI00234286C7|nr:zf-HC2 domain-containing protein [Aneurinibacillus sp. Ricciae_BoGa-3]WCK53504.1 zf-HC2 domain-containing protein [Aneurinibacillus sp. Ricciae_BoGa-3]
MRCEESYECMQRDLDNDLNSTERRALLQHLSKCPDCSLLYGRLQHISGRLEQLPMVEPPFSIVQSIMPELDRIDIERAASTWTEQAASVVPFTTDKQPANKERKVRLYRSLGGVAAAGILLSAVIYGMENKSMHESALTVGSSFAQQDTGTKSTTTGTKEVRPPAQNSVGPAEEPAAGAATADAQNKKALPPVPGGTMVAKGPDASASHAQTGSSPANEVQQQTTKPSAGNSKQSPAQGSQAQPQNQAPVAGSKSDNQSSSQSSAKDQPKKQENSSPALVASDNNNTQPPAPANKAGATVAEGSVAALDKPRAGRYSIAGFAAPEASAPNQDKAGYRPPGIPSSDEKYFVSESDHQLLIRDKDGKITFATHVWPETYKVNYHWISGRIVEYTLDSGDGKAPPDIWLIDMDNNTERPIYNK